MSESEVPKIPFECPKCGAQVGGIDSDGDPCPGCLKVPACHWCGWVYENTPPEPEKKGDAR